MNLKTTNIQELKAYAADFFVLREQHQNGLNDANRCLNEIYQQIADLEAKQGSPETLPENPDDVNKTTEPEGSEEEDQ